jgi:hypothetical protein
MLNKQKRNPNHRCQFRWRSFMPFTPQPRRTRIERERRLVNRATAARSAS